MIREADRHATPVRRTSLHGRRAVRLRGGLKTRHDGHLNFLAVETIAAWLAPARLVLAVPVSPGQAVGRGSPRDGASEAAFVDKASGTHGLRP
jgi:hypothetical protein